MAISKKLRFEIFKRDGFKCCYCGNSPPKITLEIDHVNPKSKGGNNSLDNLITACFDCNRGKSNIPLSKIPNTLSMNLDILKEQQEQMKCYNEYLEKIHKEKLQSIWEIKEIYEKHFPNREFPESFIYATLMNVLDKLPKQIVKNSMALACSKIHGNWEQVMKYFCGICWNIIKGR
jgi:CRISPR/Cas system Type II protein with McrA/HNH and RuvC-like nuclease domain